MLEARAQTAAVKSGKDYKCKTVSQVKSENKQSMQDAARKRNRSKFTIKAIKLQKLKQWPRSWIWWICNTR